MVYRHVPEQKMYPTTVANAFLLPVKRMLVLPVRA